MKDLILFPFNGNAKEALTVIEAINSIEKKWNVLGFIDDDPSLLGNSCLGIEVIGGKEQLEKYPNAFVLAVPGRPENHLQRKAWIDSLHLPKERFATLIHPSCKLGSDTTIGYNTLLMASIVTTINVQIGNHCVILPSTVLSHDVKVGDYCLIGSNVSLSGHVVIQPLTYIGTGSKLIQEIEIGEGSLIGIGAIVLRSVAPRTVVVGNPARKLRGNL